MSAEKIALKHLKERERASDKVEIIEVNRARMTKLNKQFMGRSGPTDVLSFPLTKIPGEKNSFIGTVVVCSDIIKEQSIQNGKTYQEEFEFIVRHGIDHLIGIHHE